MGNWLFKGKKKSRVSDLDRAKLQLQTQKDKLTKYKKRINAIIKKEKELCRQLMQKNDKKRALITLRKKKHQEKLLDSAQKQQDNIQDLMDTLDTAEFNQRVFAALKVGTKALQKLNAETKLEDVDRLMDDSREAIAYQEEVSTMLAESLTEEDDEEAEAMLAEIEAQMLKDKLDTVDPLPQDDLTVSKDDIQIEVKADDDAEQEEEEEEDKVAVLA